MRKLNRTTSSRSRKREAGARDAAPGTSGAALRAGTLPVPPQLVRKTHITGLPHFQFTAFSSFLLKIPISSKNDENAVN